MMYKQLISEQRYTISVLLQRKCTLKFIAETIKVSVSTVSREIKRNSNEKGVYNAHLAVQRTKRRRAKTPGNRSIGQHVRTRVFGLIRNEQWSPEQIAGRLKTEEGINVSKSTIYNWISSCPRITGTAYTKASEGAEKRLSVMPDKGGRISQTVYPLMKDPQRLTAEHWGTGRWTLL